MLRTRASLALLLALSGTLGQVSLAQDCSDDCVTGNEAYGWAYGDCTSAIYTLYCSIGYYACQDTLCMTWSGSTFSMTTSGGCTCYGY